MNLKNSIQLYIMHIVPSNGFHQERYRGIIIAILEPCCLKKAINIGFTHFCDCRQSGKIVVAFVIVVSIKPRRYTYRKNQDDYSYNR